jgi:AcrR family transcriptional regulator
MGDTRQRSLAVARAAFADRGFDATSLDDVARTVGVRKQTILYYFPSKDTLLAAVIDTTAIELAAALERALTRAPDGWERVEAVVRSVFRLAARHPDILAFVREVSRLGPPATTQMVEALAPLVARATSFLDEEMAAGRLRRHDPQLVLLLAYSAVLVVTTEVGALRAVGMAPTPRTLLRHRRDLLAFFKSALVG